MAARSLSWHVGMLVFIAAAPLLVLATALLGWTALATRQAAESGLREAARALGTGVEREVAVWTASLYELAAFPGFDCNPSDAFRSQAGAMAARHDAWVVLGGADGRERMSTLASPQRQAFRALRPGVSELFTDPATGARAVFVAVPVASARHAFCWLSLGVPAERFAGLLDPDMVGHPGWTGVLSDSANRVIASSREPWRGAQGMQLAPRRIAGGRWTLAVAAPSAELTRAWLAPLAAGSAAALLIVFFSMWAALAYARRLRREMAALKERAARVDEASSADRSKDLFIATLSHELRGALTAVIGWLDVARSSLNEPQTLARALDTALRNANQQARIIDDLLDVSRIVSGKFAVRRHPLELGRLAREGLEAWRPEAEAKRVELRARLHEPVFVEGDAERLLQVMSNLLGNAVKFNRPGGWVELTLEHTGAQVRLQVADNGAGIAPEALPHVFERFWQGPSREKRAGLGLGLQLVQHIVELHEGHVAAESGGPGKGARFTVVLPALTVREQALAEEAGLGVEEPAPSLYGLGVVAIDDEDDTLGWLQHLFARHGAMTWTAHSPQEGIDYLSRVQPDVLVSGMAITGQEARRLIQALHERRLGKPVAAVAFSKEPTDEERDGALAAGYDGFVAKPCDPAALVRAVRAVVHRPGA